MGSRATTVDRAWQWVGDRALLRRFPDADSSAGNRSARALYDSVRALGAPEVEDVVPGATSVLVVLRPGAQPSSALTDAIEADPAAGASADEAATIHEILVAYGGDHGPDLEEVAGLHDIDAAALVEMHASAAYTVAFLGFAPGFAYLLGLPAGLATPRLATPRARVPAGSVAIGGTFTSIYPRETPGGWRIIGRAETILFDPRLDPPARLLPGDRVRFVPR